jgi:hypothetical protein
MPCAAFVANVRASSAPFGIRQNSGNGEDEFSKNRGDGRQRLELGRGNYVDSLAEDCGMDLNQEKTLALPRIELFRRRYKEFGEKYLPLQTAIQWAALFGEREPDLDKMKLLVHEAQSRRNEFDLSYFTFCNHMQTTFQQCQKDILGGR